MIQCIVHLRRVLQVQLPQTSASNTWWVRLKFLISVAQVSQTTALSAPDKCQVLDG